MSATRTLFTTVAQAAILFTVASWVIVFAITFFMPSPIALHEEIAALLAVFVPDGLATWWIFRKLRVKRPRKDARRAATAFAVCAPIVLAVGYPLGSLVGAYVDALLGHRFIIPAVAVFIIVLMVFIPNTVVQWALHPSGGVEPADGSDQR